jgi:hypothetical protein
MTNQKQELLGGQLVLGNATGMIETMNEIAFQLTKKRFNSEESFQIVVSTMTEIVTHFQQGQEIDRDIHLPDGSSVLTIHVRMADPAEHIRRPTIQLKLQTGRRAVEKAYKKYNFYRGEQALPNI